MGDEVRQSRQSGVARNNHIAIKILAEGNEVYQSDIITSSSTSIFAFHVDADGVQQMVIQIEARVTGRSFVLGMAYDSANCGEPVSIVYRKTMIIISKITCIFPWRKIGRYCSCWKKSWIGIGAAVSNNLSICEECMIGASAVVVNDIEESGTYVGIPARRLV